MAAASPWSTDLAPGPLGGVRVLDLSRVLAGPLCTCVLGDLGADVIKVERPGGDETRRWGPPWHGQDAAYFLAVNRNRRSVELDLAGPTGQAATARLAESADVVVENFLPAQLRSLGLSELARGDRLVWVSIRAAGSDGPDADMPGYDAMAQARSGLMSVTGDPATGPTRVGVAVDDVVTGLYAAIAAVSALYHRRLTGHGQRVEVPLLECAVSVMINQALNHLVGGDIPEPAGRRHPNLAPYGDYACAGGRRVAIAGGTEPQFQRLCAVLGLDSLARDARFADNASRVAHREALDAAIEARLLEQPIEPWLSALQAAGVPCAPVNTLDQVFSDAHLRAVEMVQTMAHPAGPLAQLRSPLRFERTPATLRRPPPLLGEHTAEVLGALGMSPPGSVPSA